jgi:inner membrane protein
MPSPLGHAIGAVAAGWAVKGQPRRLTALLYAAVGVAPDLDLLVGTHSTYTHSVGAIAIVFVAAWASTRFRSARPAAAIAAAWASHLLLDWLGSDTSAPIGIMALWPFTTAHYQSSFHVFDAISRRYWLPEQFVWRNLLAAIKEVVILGPFAVMAYWITRKPPTNTMVTKDGTKVTKTNH